TFLCSRWRRVGWSSLFPYTTLFRSIGFWRAEETFDCARCTRVVVAQESGMNAQRHDDNAIRCGESVPQNRRTGSRCRRAAGRSRSEEHTSELQSRSDIVCRLLLEKK